MEDKNQKAEGNGENEDALEMIETVEQADDLFYEFLETNNNKKITTGYANFLKRKGVEYNNESRARVVEFNAKLAEVKKEPKIKKESPWIPVEMLSDEYETVDAIPETINKNCRNGLVRCRTANGTITHLTFKDFNLFWDASQKVFIVT